MYLYTVYDISHLMSVTRGEIVNEFNQSIKSIGRYPSNCILVTYTALYTVQLDTRLNYHILLFRGEIVNEIGCNCVIDAQLHNKSG